MGQMFNQFMEEITWTNYGGPLVTILGRDIGMFIVGYLTHLIITALIELFVSKKEDKNERNKKNR